MVAFDVTYPPGSDEWWLRTLHARLNARPAVPNRRIRESRRSLMGRRDWMDVLWAYRTGEPPLRSLDRGRRDDVREVLRLGRANYAGLSVQSMLDIIDLTGVRTAGDADSDGDDTFRAILSANGSWLADALDFSFTMSLGFVMVGRSADGHAVITAEDPRNCVAITDPLDPMNVTQALKVYMDDVERTTHAHLFLGSRGSERVRVATRTASNGWEWDDDRSGPLPFQGHGLPLVPLPNKLGMGEFEPHLDVLDRINNMISDRLWVTKIQAFRQRGLIPERDAADIPSVDEKGAPVDLDALFEASPDALWKMPPGWKIWESTPLDIRPILDATKDDVREFSAVSGTPLAIVSSDNQNQTAQGAKNVRSALTDKARDRMTRATPAIRRIARLALAAEGKSDLAVQPVEVMWGPIDLESMASRGQAAVSAKDSGVPWEIRMADIWKFSPDTIARAKKQRLDDFILGGDGGDADSPAS